MCPHHDQVLVRQTHLRRSSSSLAPFSSQEIIPGKSKEDLVEDIVEACKLTDYKKTIKKYEEVIANDLAATIMSADVKVSGRAENAEDTKATEDEIELCLTNLTVFLEPSLCDTCTDNDTNWQLYPKIIARYNSQLKLGPFTLAACADVHKSNAIAPRIPDCRS